MGPCPVCYVGVLWPNGWMDQDAIGTEVGLATGNVVLDGDPAPSTERAITAPQFLAHCCVTVAHLSNVLLSVIC